MQILFILETNMIKMINFDLLLLKSYLKLCNYHNKNLKAFNLRTNKLIYQNSKFKLKIINRL